MGVSLVIRRHEAVLSDEIKLRTLDARVCIEILINLEEGVPSLHSYGDVDVAHEIGLRAWQPRTEDDEGEPDHKDEHDE